MGKHLVIIRSSAVAGKEADFEAWYNNIHLGEVLALPGFISGQQFRSAPGEPFSHFALFEIESDDIDATLSGLGNEFASGNMTLTDALDVNTTPEFLAYAPTGAQQQGA